MPTLPTNPICQLAADPNDRNAWAAAVETYGPMCLRIAQRMLDDRQAAADAVQDCMLAVRSAAARFQPDGDPERAARAWVARVAVNTCHAHRRRARPTTRLKAHTATAPGEASNNDEVIPRLHAAIAQLPLSLREAVSLRYLAGLDYATVAVSLGIEPGAARMRVHRAVEILRGTLSKRRLAMSTLAVAGLLEAEAAAATPPLPAAMGASLSSLPLPAVATASAMSTTAVALTAAACAVLGGGAIVVAQQPAAPSAVTAPAPPAVTPAPLSASPVTTAAWQDLFPANGLAGWIPQRGTWTNQGGVISGVSLPDLGARLHTEGVFADGEMTCRVRISGKGLGEIQLGDYTTFFTIPATQDRWATIRLVQRGPVRTCTCDGVELAAEPVAPARPGPLAFYVIRGSTIEIADARYRSP